MPAGSRRTSRRTSSARWWSSTSATASAASSARRLPRPRWWRRPEAPTSCSRYQPVGPAVARVVDLAETYPGIRISVIADDRDAIAALAAAASRRGLSIPVLLDVDVGMHRTGIEPGPAAVEVYRQLTVLDGVSPGGLHVYDGHVRDRDPATRAANADQAFAAAVELRRMLQAAGLPVSRLVAGGSPTFPAHARRPDVELSPGTTVLWDAGYGTALPDLPFQPAALLLSRVVSKPAGGRVCVDSRAQGGRLRGPAPARAPDRSTARERRGRRAAGEPRCGARRADPRRALRRPQRGAPRARDAGRRCTGGRRRALRHSLARLSHRRPSFGSVRRPRRPGGRALDDCRARAAADDLVECLLRLRTGRSVVAAVDHDRHVSTDRTAPAVAGQLTG